MEQKTKMTNQEAIKRIKEHIAIHKYRESHAIRIVEALEMAISALQAQDLQSTCNQLATDTISRMAAINALKDWYDGMIISSFRGVEKVIKALPPAQPETAKRIVGKSRDGMTFWYQCDMCNEPVDAQDDFCRGCGRRLIDE